MPRFARIQRSLFAPLLALATISVLFAACGYRSAISGTASAGAPGAQAEVIQLAILGLRNDSPEPWLDRILGDALRREMGLRSAFALVVDPADADLVLRGRIRPLEIRSKTFSSFVAALEYEVTLELDLEILRASGDVIRLDRRGLTESELYLASADIEVTRTNRLEALRHLSDVLASRVADALDMMEHPIRAQPDVAKQGAGG
jgi:hypothetical protein